MKMAFILESSELTLCLLRTGSSDRHVGSMVRPHLYTHDSQTSIPMRGLGLMLVHGFTSGSCSDVSRLEAH